MERTKDKLQGISDRIEKTGYMGSNEDAQFLSELMDEMGLRAATTDCQVSSEAQNSSQNQISNEHSLLHSYPVYLVNHLRRHRGPVSDVAS